MLAREARAEDKRLSTVCSLMRKAWMGHVDPFCVNGCCRLWDVGAYGSTQRCPSVPVARARQARKPIDHHCVAGP